MTSEYKKNLVEMIDALYETNDDFDKINDSDQFTELCGACQQTAFLIGSQIEKFEREPEKLVSYLEEYCERIYELSLMFDAHDMIPQQIDKIEMVLRCVCKELELMPVYKEVVFMPYKASMWDCFQSVYDACKTDERFQVYVVPMPYDNLDGMGNVVNQSYEGGKLPDTIQITDYHEYDIAMRKPDVILIHNPYDEWNKVTRVPREFFSKELAKHTRHLIYIPYYVSQSSSDDNMTILPGVKNSWRTFVQSEEIRKQYIQNGIREEQVVALGSPKFDMVLKEDRAGKNIPEEWSVLRGKTVYLYNTHLTGLMNHVDIFINKILKIIGYFADRNDIALLWRPHPLSIETIQTFHPEACELYRKVIELFKKSGNGVYDDSQNLERAIAVSDAYIGDEQSSVSTLYQVTGKPMYYIDYQDIKAFHKERYPRCLCAEKAGSKIYMFSWEYNCIFIYDEETAELSYRKGNENIRTSEPYVCVESVRYGEFIYFIPHGLKSNMIVKYDVLNNELKYIDMDAESGEFRALIYQNKIFLMPIYYSTKIPYLFQAEDRIEYLDVAKSGQEEGDGKNTKSFLFYGCMLVEGIVWRACRYMPAYMQKYHLDKQKIEYVKVNGLSKGIINAFTYDGQYFWLAAENEVIKWDDKENRILMKITIQDQFDDQYEKYCSDIFLCKGDLWILPYRGGIITRINRNTCEKTRIDCGQNEGFCLDTNDSQPFSEKYIIEQNDLYLLPFQANYMIKINTVDNQVNVINKQLEISNMLEKVSTDGICTESICKTWINFILFSRKYNNVERKTTEENSGEKIWNYIADQLFQGGESRHEMEK